MNREQLLGRLAEGLDDLYVLSNPPEDTPLALHTLVPNPMEIYAAAGHPLAGRRRLRQTEVADEPFLMREPGSGTRLVAERWFAAQGMRPVVRMEMGSNEAIKQAVVSGLGLALLSRHTVGAADRRDGLVALHVEGLPILRYWYLAYPENRPLSRIAQAFVADATRPETLAQLAMQTQRGRRKLSSCLAR
jgi:DNA-binding transcriptional LysR family regulator